jgi:hypothetical protein
MPFPDPNDKLESWKEIASFIGRDVRTSIRWAKDRGMPVHRIPGGDRSRVYASRSEIKAWVEGKREEKPAELPSTAQAAPSKRTKSQLVAGVAIVLIAAGALAFAIRWRSVRFDRRTQLQSAMGEPLPSQYDFEDGEQGWTVRPNMMIRSVAVSDSRHWEGNRSLAIVFDGSYSRKSQIYVVNPPISAGVVVTARVWCPAENQLQAVALFVEDHDRAWNNDWRRMTTTSQWVPGSWNKLVVQIPSDAALPLSRMGLEFTASSRWAGICYLDDVQW